MVDINVISKISQGFLATGIIAKSLNVRLLLIKKRVKTLAILLTMSAKFDINWLARENDITFKWEKPQSMRYVELISAAFDYFDTDMCQSEDAYL